jgi:hypothetical protein
MLVTCKITLSQRKQKSSYHEDIQRHQFKNMGRTKFNATWADQIQRHMGGPNSTPRGRTITPIPHGEYTFKTWGGLNATWAAITPIPHGGYTFTNVG